MIKYYPRETLEEIATKRSIKKLLKTDLSAKKAALNFVDGLEFLDDDAAARVALKTIRSYRRIVKETPEAAAEIAENPARLVHNVIGHIAEEIKDTYKGERYKWIPSSADEADPEHQLLYGKTLPIDEGDNEGNLPGERYGCQCGMEILVDETELDLK